MRCPNCSYDENADDATFCGGCRHSLSAAAACPSCGREYTTTDTFCQGCGQSVEPARSGASTSTPAPVLPKAFASGRYQVQRFLGEGGKKRVYLAHDTKLDSDVAVAVIKTDTLSPDELAAISREAQSMGRPLASNVLILNGL